MFLVFRFLQFLCQFVISRARATDEHMVFSSLFCIYTHLITGFTMIKTENGDFAFIFSGKHLINTLSQINYSDIVVVTMNFHLHSAREMLIWNSCLTKKREILGGNLSTAIATFGGRYARELFWCDSWHCMPSWSFLCIKLSISCIFYKSVT